MIGKRINLKNDIGFNALVDGFAELFLGSSTTKSLFDFNDNTESAEGFATVVAGTIGGALIGYTMESTIEYYFPSSKKPW